MPLYYLSNLFAYKLYQDQILSHRDIRKFRYAMTVILSELLKIFGLVMIFYVLGLLDLFLFSFCILLSIRSFSGGLHVEKSLACFCITLVFFALTVILLPNLFVLHFIPAAVLGAISLILIYRHSPRPSPLRSIIDKKRRRNLKYISVSFTFLWLGILFLYPQTTLYFDCGIWTIFLQAVQLTGKEVHSR